MLAKKYRVPVQNFPRRAKTSYSGRLFVVKNSPNNLRHSRLGVIVAKGAVKTAVHRNKIKRIVAEAFAKDVAVLKKPGSDYLVIINPSDKLDGAYDESLKREVASALDKLKNN